MEYLTLFWAALWELTHAMAPYILFGLVFAGILHELVPDALVTKHLGADNIASVVKSTLFGIPLPVCSCGVIPLATSIKKSGASKGATLSFLISTPITGVDSLMATYGMFGWVFTIYRTLTSMVIAMVAGILTNIFDRETEEKLHMSHVHESLHSEESCCSTQGSCCSSGMQENQGFSFQAAMQYAFITLFGDIAKALFWGLIIGAFITIMIPQNLSDILQEYSWLSYLIVIMIAIPMYVCATASLPIAAALMLSGVSAGAAFVFLSAGPATNTVTIGVVKKMLGVRALLIYLGSIMIGSILFGLGLDYIFSIQDINPASLIHIQEHVGLVTWLSSLILWALILYFIIREWFPKKV